MLSGAPVRASLLVAPLDIPKCRSENVANGANRPRHQERRNLFLQSQMTPPATPNGSDEDLLAQRHPPPVFHNFLRAFYPFQPSNTISDTSVTLPLDEGDVILVHSVHTNGWADGSLLATGARGWLPTNYCDAYEPEDMRGLLKALLNFWDLLSSTSVHDHELFMNQEFMKGLVAGVRFLLERTHCLNRESAVVQRNEMLRRCRKSLLSELSSLVKTTKRIQETQRGTNNPPESINEAVDEMILKAFRIVTKGVRFLDAIEEDRKARAPAAVTVMATVAEESSVPPTPPADRIASATAHQDSAVAPPKGQTLPSHAPDPRPAAIGSKRMLPGSLQPAMAHRLSLAGPPSLSRPHHLASEQLGQSHDKFLSHLGSFIGRLHLQFHSRPELALAVKQSATSGGVLLAVIDGVITYNHSSADVLNQVRVAMFQRIQALVLSARYTLTNTAAEGPDIIMPQDNSMLLMAATACVRAAGECVARTKAAIERIGDFEFEIESSALGIDLSDLEAAAEAGAATPAAVESTAGTDNLSEFPTAAASNDGRRSAGAGDRSLPRRPKITIPTTERDRTTGSPTSSQPASAHEDNSSSATSSASSTCPMLPPLPKLSNTPHSSESTARTETVSHDHDAMHASRYSGFATSSAGSRTTYLSRDSQTSVLSQTSTRATTPDHTLMPRTQPSMSELSAAACSMQADEAEEVESKLLEKTYAHELMFNKEGHVIGGSLPALVERLTTHESTPDATFVSTFYLTFRLFCTPVKLAEALIERFDYVSDAPHMSGPVRLRVYNAFKGWLESHWRERSDREALKLIIPFAEEKLGSVIPSAGRRLVELARRVSGDGSLVPRLVSSMGKTNTALANYIPADAPLPAPILSKSQQNMLVSFKTGGNSPLVLDFDSLELARQLTIKQMAIFCSILPEELLASQWMKNGGADAPNVKAMSSLSTDLSNLVAETILQFPEVKKRAAVVKHWIKVAHHCHELRNYDGLMAIICSLNSSTICRLRKTWDAIPVKRRETLRALQKIVDPSQNNKILRHRLFDHVPPCLPFLGMYLTDLTFVDIGNPPTKQMSLGTGSEEDGTGGLTVVNFDKHTRTAKIIGDLQRFQIPYRLVELSDMQDWLASQIGRLRDGDPDNVQVSYYRKSLLLEPREASASR